MRIRTTTAFYVATDDIGSTLTESWETYDDAVKYWERTCRDRKKGDEYDKFWNSLPCMIIGRTHVETRFF